MGLLLVLFGGVLVYIFASQDDPSREVLALARDVSKGDVLSAAHIAVLEGAGRCACGRVVAAVGIAGFGVLGDRRLSLRDAARCASADRLCRHPAGHDHGGSDIRSRGNIRLSASSRGDRVNILALNSQGSYAIVARNVEVHEVTRLAEGAGASLFVAFLVPGQMQTQVVSAIASGSIRLGLVPSEELAA